MLTLILATILLTGPSSDDEWVVFKNTPSGVMAPDEEACRYAIKKLSEINKGFYRVEPLEDGTFRISLSPIPVGRFTYSEALEGEQSDESIRVPAKLVEEGVDKNPPRAEYENGKYSVWADMDSMHDVLFAIMSEAKRPYQVGPSHAGSGRTLPVYGMVTIFVSRPTVEEIFDYVLRQVEAIFVLDGKELIVLDAAGSFGRKSVGYTAIDNKMD